MNGEYFGKVSAPWYHIELTVNFVCESFCTVTCVRIELQDFTELKSMWTHNGWSASGWMWILARYTRLMAAAAGESTREAGSKSFPTVQSTASIRPTVYHGILNPPVSSLAVETIFVETMPRIAVLLDQNRGCVRSLGFKSFRGVYPGMHSALPMGSTSAATSALGNRPLVPVAGCWAVVVSLRWSLDCRWGGGFAAVSWHDMVDQDFRNSETTKRKVV
eukprot:COSAG02_NODE_8644_length_2494_cov_1.907307_3_plen_219_part_00